MNNEDELSRLLRQPRRAGVYHLPRTGVEPIAAAARRVNFAIVECDLAGCADKAGFLARIAAALRFPDWFGHNWDALADCLSDLSWLPADGYIVILHNADRFRGASEKDFVMALEILSEAAAGWAGENVAFWVFVGLTADGIPLLRSLW